MKAREEVRVVGEVKRVVGGPDIVVGSFNSFVDAVSLEDADEEVGAFRRQLLSHEGKRISS